MDQPLTSLDRFLQNRGPAFIGLGGTKVAINLNTALGSLFTLMGLGFIAGSFIAHEPGMAFASIGPLFGGGVNFTVAGLTRRHASKLDMVAVKLTDEAKRFMHRLMRQAFGWRYQWVGWEPYGYGANIGMRGRRLRRSGMLWDATTDQRRSSELLSPEVYGALEEATGQYNRIYGLLVTAETSGSTALRKMRPTVMRAADETMAEVLHHAALMDKYPESDDTPSATIARLTESLKEAANRIESLQRRESTAIPSSPASAMEAVLDELRLQDVASAELEEASEQRQDVGQGV
jgi:hypothetical protein